ncbi:sensor histidine kinase [Ekhidna sp.]
MSKYARYHLIGTVLIFFLGGIVNMTVFCPNCLKEPFFLSRNFNISFCYSGAAWAAYWKGSEFLVELWDKHIPWIVAPLKRFFVSLVSITIYVFLVVWALDIYFDLVFFEKSFSEVFEDSNSSFTTSLMITLGINVFMHGRGFLISWRQASIDVEKLKTEQVSTQYESLKNQVNPHFLFNSFNALSSLVYEDQDKAVEFIRKLSNVYRYVLECKDEEVVELSKEMDFAKNFIFLQKIRFGDNLSFDINTSNPSAYVPPLAIQILIENAVKHNVVSEQYPLNVKLDIDDEYCTITNNLKEKKTKDSTGIGLDNLISRYRYLTDKEVKVEKTENTFVVKLPLLKIEK